jgi:Cu+-exporting ATPase
MVLMFWPQTVIPMETINRLVLVPATIVQAWAGRRFYVAAWRALRHGSLTMDTLVVIGTTAAWAYSVFVTLFPEVVHEAGLHPETYFDSSTIILGLVLLGRWLEARAKTRAGQRPAARSGLQPRDGVARRGRRRPGGSGRRVQPGATSSASGPALGSRSTESSSLAPPRSTNRC